MPQVRDPGRDAPERSPSLGSSAVASTPVKVPGRLLQQKYNGAGGEWRAAEQQFAHTVFRPERAVPVLATVRVRSASAAGPESQSALPATRVWDRSPPPPQRCAQSGPCSSADGGSVRV